MPDTHSENYIQIVGSQGLGRNSLCDAGRSCAAQKASAFAGLGTAGSAFCMKLKYIEKLPVTLCLALSLSLMSVFAHADDNSLIREANASLAKKDYNTAFSKFFVLAQHGNATAQFNLGAFYFNGQGVQRDEKQAFDWFAKSAAQGKARALQVIQSSAAKGNENAKNALNTIQRRMASPQSQPQGQSQQVSSVPGDDKTLWVEANAALAQKDYNTAFSKFFVLAQHGNATAQFNLGAFYLNGQGVQRDEKQAFDWFAKSAAQGKARALQVIQSSAAKGNENAKNALNTIQRRMASPQSQPQGQSQQVSSVPGDDKTLWVEANAALAQKDYNTAFSKFFVLAQHGNATAQFNLGAFYLNGQGVQRDEKQALDWFAKSAANGNSHALQIVQSAAAQENEKAKRAHEGLTQSKTVATPSSGLDVAGQASATSAATHAGSGQSSESSSNFSLGVSLGQTSKLTGINNSPSLGLLAGYKFNSKYGVELAYNSLYRNANADKFLSATNPGTNGTFDLNSLSVAGQYTYGLSSKLSVLGNLGFHSSNYTLKSSGNASRTGSANGLIVGLKVQYYLSKSVGVRGGFDTYTESGGITGTLTEFGLAVIYNF